MKIIREKQIRQDYIKNHLDLIANQILKSVTGESKLTGSSIKVLGEGKIKSYRNICLVTGRARGVIKTHSVSRFVFKSDLHLGRLEGFKKAS